MEEPTTEEILLVSEQLNRATDDLNEAISSVEAGLKRSHIAVSVRTVLWVEALEEDPVEYERGLLGFEKFSGAWRLLYIYQRKESDGWVDTDVQPLVNARREMRIVAVEHLDELLAAAMATTRREIERVDAAIEAALAFEKTLEPG